MATQFSFQKLDDGAWGVKVSANLGEAGKFTGSMVTVTKRNGEQKVVELGTKIDEWNGGRAAVYEVAGKKRQREQKPVPASDLTPIPVEAAMHKAALECIAFQLNGGDRSPATLENIAVIVKAAGFTIDEAAA